MSISVIMIMCNYVFGFQLEFCLNVFAQTGIQRLAILLVGFQTSVCMLNASLVV